MSRARTICVGVPVWRAAAFVAETLESIRRQRSVDFIVAVSIDGADAESELACRPFLTDPRFRIMVQPHRLGWVRNSAAVLAAAPPLGADYVCIQPHDDLLDEDYLASLLDIAEQNPGAAAVYCDLTMVGGKKSGAIVSQQPVTGTPLERQISLLKRHFGAVAYRGLTRTKLLAQLPTISGNAHDDFAADTVWMARLATMGDLIRVPRTLYRKRMHANNTHTSWNRWPSHKKIDTWHAHCVDMLAVAATVAPDGPARHLLYDTAVERLLQRRRPLGPYRALIRSLSRKERRKLLSRFDHCVRELGIYVSPAERLRKIVNSSMTGLPRAVTAWGRKISKHLAE